MAGILRCSYGINTKADAQGAAELEQWMPTAYDYDGPDAWNNQYRGVASRPKKSSAPDASARSGALPHAPRAHIGRDPGLQSPPPEPYDCSNLQEEPSAAGTGAIELWLMLPLILAEANKRESHDRTIRR